MWYCCWWWMRWGCKRISMGDKISIVSNEGWTVDGTGYGALNLHSFFCRVQKFVGIVSMDVMRHAVIFWTSPTQPHVSQHSYVSVVCIAFSSRSIVRMTPDTLSWKGNHRRRVLSSKILERARCLPPLSPSDDTIAPFDMAFLPLHR